MIKKIMFILIMMFIISGCEAVYNLDIDELYSESVVITPTSDAEATQFKSAFDEIKYTSHLTDDYDPEEEAPEGVEYYTKSISETGALTLGYKFNMNNFNDSRLANTCFPSFLFIKGKHLRFNTVADFDCYTDYPELEKVTINIKVKGEVYNHNADSVNGNIYTWTIKPGQLRSLNLEYENPETKEDDPNNNNGSGNSGNNGNNSNNQNGNNNSNKNTKKKKTISASDGTIYLLTGLFFAFLFGIIIFTGKYKKN